MIIVNVVLTFKQKHIAKQPIAQDVLVMRAFVKSIPCNWSLTDPGCQKAPCAIDYLLLLYSKSSPYICSNEPLQHHLHQNTIRRSFLRLCVLSVVLKDIIGQCLVSLILLVIGFSFDLMPINF